MPALAGALLFTVGLQLLVTLSILTETGNSAIAVSLSDTYYFPVAFVTTTSAYYSLLAVFRFL